MIDKNLWAKFYELYKQYVAGYEKYSEAEISFELDEIAGGLLPTLLENLFNAWFPELKEVELIEVGDGNFRGRLQKFRSKISYGRGRAFYKEYDRRVISGDWP